MNKEIRYGGYSANPNEYVSEDGELAMAMNLIPESGGLRPVKKGKRGFAVPNGQKIFLHKPENNTNFIGYGEGSVEWLSNNDSQIFQEPKTIFAIADEIVDITSLGNVLIISTNNEMHYARWDSAVDDYIYLGSQVPKVGMQFALKLSLEGAYSKQEISLTDSASTTTQSDEWVLISKTQNITLENYTDTYSSHIFTSNSIDGVSFPKEYEYKVVVTTNLKKPVQGYDRFVTAKILRVGDNALFGEGKTIKSIPRSDFEQVFVQIVTSIEIENVTFSLTIYRGNEYKYDEGGEIRKYQRIENTQDNFNHITGQINKFINEKGTLDNKFIYPFFVRFATRLYDDTYSYISAPILMMPNSGYAPCVSYGNGDNKLRLYAWVGQLQHKAVIPNEIEAWKDLIVGVDVFVSAPIYTYNQGEGWQSNVSPYRFKYSNVNAFGIGNAPNFDKYKYMWTKVYTEECANVSLILDDRISDVEVCPFSKEEIDRSIASVDNYYKIKSYSLEELSGLAEGFVDIELTDGTLQSLQARESLQDTIVKQKFTQVQTMTYNNRLILSKGARMLPNADTPSECRGYCQANLGNGADNTLLPMDRVNVYIHLKTEQGERMIKADNQTTDVDGYISILNGIGWFYYPDATAYKATIFFHEKKTDKWLKGEYQLKSHDFLNGAYWTNETLATDMVSQAQYVENKEVEEWANKNISNLLQNIGKIYVSEAENPWTFIVGNSRTIGDGELMGIATASKALSEGQFGAFPLYAFTTEGVWSLAVAQDGTFNPAQPITRDVCISADSITQIDQSVLFATDRGVMMIQGSDTICLTDKIDTDTPLDLTKQQGGERLIDLSGVNAESFGVLPFKEFLQGSSMVYDYKNQRIILYNKECKYAYVYSFESKAWGMMESNIVDSINSYPDAMVVTDDNHLVNLSKEDKDKAKGLMVTRALKLDGADVLKTIDTLVQRGNFNRGDVSTILWGSRDLKNWHLVWSSKDHYMRGFRGTPYKYYRIGALTNLGEDENLVGVSINHTPKQTNQIR